MKTIINFFINIYQKILSPDTGIVSYLKTGSTCRFIPTCSEYMKIAINKYGLCNGLYMGIKRIIRCGPWSKGGADYP